MCPLTMRHTAKAAAAAERAGVPVSALLRSRDDSASAGGAPEAEGEHEKHARIHAQALSQSGPEQDNDVRGGWSVQQTTRST